MKGLIYKITSPTGRIYIGCTTKNSINERYKYGVDRKQHKLYWSVNKYGWENHTKEVIEELTLDNNKDPILFEREIYWISKFNSFKDGLNCTEGGGGTTSISEEMKIKISNSLKGNKNRNLLGLIKDRDSKPKIAKAKIDQPKIDKRKFVTDETKKKISISLKGKTRNPISEETKQKIREGNNRAKRKPLSDEHKLKLKLMMKEKFNTPEAKQKMSNSLKIAHSKKQKWQNSN